MISAALVSKSGSSDIIYVLKPMGFQMRGAQHPSHHHVTGTDVVRQLSGAPVRRSVGWRFTSCLQNLGLQSRRALLNLPSAMLRIQSSKPGLKKALPPAADPRWTASQSFRDVLIRVAVSQHQDESRTLNVLRAKALGPAASREFSLLKLCKHDGLISFKHSCSTVSHRATHINVTVH